MFMWVVVVVILVAFLVYIWAEQGGRLSGTALWLALGTMAAALLVWVVAQEAFRLHQLLAFALFLPVLALGYQQLRRRYPPKKRPALRKALRKKAAPKRHRKHR